MKKILLPALLVLFINVIHAQYYYYNNNYYDNDVIFEVGPHFGSMHGLTDVGGKDGGILSNLKFKSAHASSGAFAAVMYRQTYGARIEATWGTLEGNDADGKNKERKLSYRTKINEIAVIGELHPVNLFGNIENGAPMVSPYIALGGGWFSFDPQAKYNGRYISLQPLNTVGQGFAEYRSSREPYNLHQVNIIYGFGLKADVTPLISIRAELLVRKLFTDFLDDASGNYIDPSLFDKNLSPEKAVIALAMNNPGNIPWQYKGNLRGDPKDKDSYFSFSLKASVNMGKMLRY